MAEKQVTGNDTDRDGKSGCEMTKLVKLRKPADHDTRQSINIAVDRDLWRRAKVEAARRGMTLRELLKEALRHEVGYCSISVGGTIPPKGGV